MRDFHIDALRLDAIHGIVDRNARPFLELLAVAVERFRNESDRKVFLIAESDLNDSRFVGPRDKAGMASTRSGTTTSPRPAHPRDRRARRLLPRLWQHGRPRALVAEKATFTAANIPSFVGGATEIPRVRLWRGSWLCFHQNHDQVGNRMLGERLPDMVDFATQKLCAAMVLFSPFLPLLFMGEEYGERAPFPYFTSHSDPQLVEAVRRGLREEFAAFRWEGTPPDPQAEATFSASKLNRDLLDQEPHRTLSRFYQELIWLRTSLPALRELSKERIE